MSSSMLTPLIGSAATVTPLDLKIRLPNGTEGEGTFLGSLHALAQEMPSEALVVSDDVTLVRQGPMFRFEGAGAGNLTFGMQSMLLRAFEAGETAADYLKGYSAGHNHPLHKDHELTVGEHRALAQAARSAEPGEPTAADVLLDLLQRYARLEFHHRVPAGERHSGSQDDDAIQAGKGAEVSGMGGDDWIDGQENLRASGGSGNDVIAGYDDAKLRGGRGDDRLRGYDRAILDGGTGDDHLEAHAHARIAGGDGHDYISAYTNARIDGGTGNDFISADVSSVIDGGEGHDLVEAGNGSHVKGGAGNDILRVGDNATAAGGAGDDTIRVGREAVIRFGRGDGSDILEARGGGAWNTSLAQLTGTAMPDTLNSTSIVLGPNISIGDIAVTRDGDDLRIAIVGSPDSLLIRNVTQRGVPALVFADGTTVKSAELLPRAAAA